MSKKVFVTILILFSCKSSLKDPFENHLASLGYEVMGTKTVERTFVNQYLAGKTYTFYYNGKIQTGCLDVSKAEFINCITLIDLTIYNHLSDSGFREAMYIDLVNKFKRRSKATGLSEDDTEFLSKTSNWGPKKVNSGVLYFDENEVMLVTEDRIITLGNNSNSQCKLPNILHEFYLGELYQILGLKKIDLENMEM